MSIDLYSTLHLSSLSFRELNYLFCSLAMSAGCAGPTLLRQQWICSISASFLIPPNMPMHRNSSIHMHTCKNLFEAHAAFNSKYGVLPSRVLTQFTEEAIILECLSSSQCQHR